MINGLHNFIKDLKKCTTSDLEKKRVDKEMAKIRNKMTKKLDGYNKKKYVWKLLYCYMLGYDVEIGHMAAIQLITSNKFSEKTCGYMACSLLLNETHELLTLICNSIQKDLTDSPTNEYAQCLALACVGNIGGQQFAESLTTHVQDILLGKSRPQIRKKAALCLLRLFRKYPDCIPQEGDFASKLIPMMNDPNLGVAISVTSLVLGMVAHDITGWQAIPAASIELLSRLVFYPDKNSKYYKYYLTICPWLQVKLLRLLQYFPPSATDRSAIIGTQHTLTDILHEILNKTIFTNNINKNNADHSILFEAISLIIHQCANGVMDLHSQAIGFLGRFVTIKEPNFRYLGLETMTRLARIPSTLQHIKRHQNTIQFCLQDVDVSIRKRALDLLYSMCDKSNARDIVSQLLKYLQLCSHELREETVLKIAILAEKFAVDLRWYLDVILQLISLAGDHVSDDIWYRSCQIVTNTEELQDYAASTCYKFLSSPTVHENGVKVAAYILGEFGHQIKDKSVTGQKLFDVLKAKFSTSTIETKGLILSAYIKMANTYPALKVQVDTVFKAHRSYADPEIQQRACEYHVMNNSADDSLMNMVFDVMPNFPERESLLLRRLRKAKNRTADRDVWDVDDKDKKGKKNDKGDESNTESSSSGSDKEEKSDEEDDSSSDSSSSDSSSDDDSDGVESFPPPSKTALIGLLKSPQGTLYDSESLQILCQHKVEPGGISKMVLYYCNKSSSPMVDFTAQLPNSNDFAGMVTPSDNFTVLPQGKTKQFFQWKALQPFNEPPVIKVSFSFNDKPKSIVLKLPLLASSFVIPTGPMDFNAFMTAWKSTQSGEVVGKHKMPSLVPAEEMKIFIADNLHCTIMEGLEKPRPDRCNITAAGSLNTPTGPQPILLRMETVSTLPIFRLTVHSPSIQTSQALSSSLSILLDTSAA